MIESDKPYSGFSESSFSKGRQADLHGTAQPFGGVDFSVLHSVCMPLTYSLGGIGLVFHVHISMQKMGPGGSTHYL